LKKHEKDFLHEVARKNHPKMKRPHLHHIVREKAPKNWSKKNRGYVY